MRQPLVAAARGDDAEAGGARPVDQVADERGLIAVGEAVDHARLLPPSARAADRRTASASTVTMTTCLPVAERGERVLDRRDRIAGGLDHDVDRGMRDQRLPVVADSACGAL